MTQYSDFLAMPLTDIYNAITMTCQWPSEWKIEYVTVRNSEKECVGRFYGLKEYLMYSVS